METVTVPVPEGSPIATTSRLKEKEQSTPPDENRSSPPPNCAICLGPCQRKSFTDSCLHQFCFNCLLTWSKIKAECPLCKQTFKSIIHNVRSNQQYEEYPVGQHPEVLTVDDPPVADPQLRFRYRTTITFPRRNGTAIHRLLLNSPLLADVALPPRPDLVHHRRSNTFRHLVYGHNLWARPLPDFTGRFRESSPEFYRSNEAQRYRLVPWLTRELEYALRENAGHVAYVMARILDMLPICAINSPEFHAAMLPFFGEHVEHFLHEFYCFATTPYDMLGYDRNVKYGPDPRLPATANLISSSEVDSDVEMLGSPNLPTPPRAPSPAQNIIPIETISHSDSENSENEVVVVGYIKPPQDRTPEVVDLLASDSDVLVQENTPPPSTSREIPPSSAIVKLTLSRRVRPPDTDSDEDFQPRRNKRPKKRVRSQDSASTTSERCATPPVSDMSWNPSGTDTASSVTVSPAPSPAPRRDEGSYTPPLHVPQPPETRSKVKKAKDDTSKDSRRHRRRVKRKRARSRSPRVQSPLHSDGVHRRKDKKLKKKKSRSRRDAESSRRRLNGSSEQPSTSGLKKEDQKKKILKSVICTLPLSSFTGRTRLSDKGEGSNSNSHSIDNILASTSQSTTSCGAAAEACAVREARPAPARRWYIASSTDTEDDLPLNLTVKK